MYEFMSILYKKVLNSSCINHTIHTTKIILIVYVLVTVLVLASKRNVIIIVYKSSVGSSC